MKSRVRIASVVIIINPFLILFSFLPNPVYGQRQFQLREMRNEMSVKLENYSFGFSWDNRRAFDSLYSTLDHYGKLLEKPFAGKNRPSNSVERDYLRLLANYGISVLENQSDKDPLIKHLLEYNPYLLPDDTDNSPDLENQLRGFYPLPSLKVGIRIGINANFNETSSTNYEVVQSDSNGKQYDPDLGWQISFPLSYLLSRNHSISLEPGISNSNIKVTEEIIGNSQTFKYRLFYGEIPVVYRYHIFNLKINGFSDIGTRTQVIANRLTSKIESIDSKIEKAGVGKSARLERRKNSKMNRRDHLALITPYRRVIPNFILGVKPKYRINSFIDSDNANELTNAFQLDAIAGLSLEWLAGKNSFSVEFRYNHGLLDINSNQRYYLGGETTGLLFNDFFVSDDFRIQTFEISFIANYILNNRAFKIR